MQWWVLKGIIMGDVFFFFFFCIIAQLVAVGSYKMKNEVQLKWAVTRKKKKGESGAY